MSLVNQYSTWKHFIRTFPSDPPHLTNLSDVEAVEQHSLQERFPCNSANEALATVARLQPDDFALTYLQQGSVNDEPQRWTYKQYREQVIAAANLFYSLGLQPSESVLFLLPNVPEMLFGLWGAQAVGIAAPVNPFLQAEQIADIAKQADARILVTVDSGHADKGEFMRKALAAQSCETSIRHVIAVGAESSEEHSGVINWAAAITAQPRDQFIFNRPLKGGETATYFHTGGTTGTPKLAPHTQRAEVINVCQIALTGPGEPEGDARLSRSVILCGLPLFHVNAVLVSALTSIMAAGELVLAGPQGFREKSLLDNFWGLVERYRVSFFSGVPTVYAALLVQSTQGYDLSSLTHCVCGAAPMPVSLLREFSARTGADIIEGYGMTETMSCASAHFYHGARNAGSIGMRVPYQKIRTVVFDSNGNIARECEVNEIGVVLLNGPNVIHAYKQETANVDAWPEPGWLNSGDMGRIDEQGYVWLTGRAKDLIIRGGHNIDPLMTEDALTTHPAVEMAAAVGKPDAYAGEVPIAYVQLHPSNTVRADELKAYAREHCAERAAAPVEVVIWQALPKTAVGKTFKPTLRKDAIARAYQQTASEAWGKGQIEVQVVEDDTHGLRVVLQVTGNSTELKMVHQIIGPELDRLAYTWELT